MRYPAQIVFIEAKAGGRWTGRLLNPTACIDMQAEGRPAGQIECKITEYANNSYGLVTHGGSKHGRRYRSFKTCSEAQNAAIKWAARRFKIEV